MRTQRLTGRPGLRQGLSIAEVMISLAISSLLLVGVTAAYNASADAVELNDRFFRATQACRVTMNQLLTEIRRCDSVLTAPTCDSIIVTRPTDLRLPNEESREYKYDPSSKRITLQIFYKDASGVTSSSPKYVLARKVQEAKFGPAATLNGLEVRIPVTLVVKISGNSVRLSGTSGPRRAL